MIFQKVLFCIISHSDGIWLLICTNLGDSETAFCIFLKIFTHRYRFLFALQTRKKNSMWPEFFFPLTTKWELQWKMLYAPYTKISGKKVVSFVSHFSQWVFMIAISDFFHFFHVINFWEKKRKKIKILNFCRVWFFFFVVKNY